MKAVHTVWKPCYRILPSRFPPIGFFERVADPMDLDAAYALEGLTNPRIREEAGVLHLIPPHERISGPGSSYIMAAFTHLRPGGSRFSDGTYGVYYAGDSLETAISETVYHTTEKMLETVEPPQDLDMRVVLADLDGDLLDVSGPEFIQLRDPDPATYGAGQAVGRVAKAAGKDGILFQSARRPSGECVAILRPKVIASARQSQHLIYPWDGKSIVQSRICVKTRL